MPNKISSYAYLFVRGGSSSRLGEFNYKRHEFKLYQSFSILSLWQQTFD